MLAKLLVRGKAMSPGMRRMLHVLSNRWRERFGTILTAYKLIGYKPSLHVFNSATASSQIRRLRADLFEQLMRLFPSRIRMVRRFRQQRFRVLELDNLVRIAVHICRICRPAVSGEPRWLLKIKPQYKRLPALICLPNRALARLTDFYFIPDLGLVDKEYKVIGQDHPWLADEHRLESLRDLCGTATRIAEGHPAEPLRTEGFSVVGDVLFTDDDPTVIVDGNEIPLSTRNADIFKLLLRNAGQVVSRSILVTRSEESRPSPECSDRRTSKGARSPIPWSDRNGKAKRLHVPESSKRTGLSAAGEGSISVRIYRTRHRAVAP